MRTTWLRPTRRERCVARLRLVCGLAFALLIAGMLLGCGPLRDILDGLPTWK